MKRITVKHVFLRLFAICALVLVLAGDDCDNCFSPSIMMLKLFVCGVILFVGSVYFTRKYLSTENEIFFIESLPLLIINGLSPPSRKTSSLSSFQT